MTPIYLTNEVFSSDEAINFIKLNNYTDADGYFYIVGNWSHQKDWWDTETEYSVTEILDGAAQYATKEYEWTFRDDVEMGHRWGLWFHQYPKESA